MSRRYEELDSLRGIAATSVVIHHCLITFSVFFAAYLHKDGSDEGWMNTIANTPLHIFWAGHEAVILFFVLSGFVLTLALSKKTNYTSYAIGRICRIYIPYILIIYLSILLLNVFVNNDYPDLSSWFNGMWAKELAFRDIVSYIFMFGHGSHNINTVTWSLVHEMRISLVFPLIVWIIYKLNWKASLLGGIAFCLFMSQFLAWLPGHLELSGMKDYLIKSFGNTFHYCSFFIMGAVLAKYRDKFGNVIRQLGISIKLMLAGLFVFLYTIEWWVPAFGELKRHASNMEKTTFTIVIDLLIGASIIILFLLVMNTNSLSDFLQKKPLVFLGKISYSLYLIHPVVLLTSVNVLHGFLPLTLIVASVPFTSIGMAAVMYYMVEKPAIKIGKRLSFAASGKKAVSRPIQNVKQEHVSN
ncbi:acyltransferase [Oceanobacillus massiliensis]|uniref:acyltransferase family protein n=1 Tax=Oceanobacillus massiliensis TaxID=1465765 RepID=UPI00301A3F7A